MPQSPENRADHDRDIRDAEWRPGDPPSIADGLPPLPARFQTPIPGAIEVAVLAQAVPLAQAAELIEQYARTMASEARLQAVAETADRMLAVMDKAGANA